MRLIPRTGRSPRFRRITIALAGMALMTLPLLMMGTPGAPALASTSWKARVQNCPWLSQKLSIQARVHMVLSHMTLADKITMVNRSAN